MTASPRTDGSSGEPGRVRIIRLRLQRKDFPMHLSRSLAQFPHSPQIARARRIVRSRRARIVLNTVFVSGALAAAAITAMHFANSGWPLANADPVLVAAAGLLFLFAYAFKAWGWQRLFAADE